MPLASLSAADPEPSRPNILFAIADDWSFGHAGAYGCGWVETPSFDRVAKEGILFTRAYTPNAKCCPARSIILTGRNSWQLEAAANHWCFFPPKFKVYTEALKESGYFVGTTGKGWAPGVALDTNGKRRAMVGQIFSKRKTPPPTPAISSNDYAGNFEDFLAAAPKDQPWCFWFGTTEPHRGYHYGSGVENGKKLADIKRVPKFWPDNETVRNDILDYAFEVEHYDKHLGRIIAAIEKAGQLDNTIVLATSDHGMPFPRCKGQAYDYSNHIPMALMWPAKVKKPGRTVDDYVSFADIAPTLLEAAGLTREEAGMQPFAGSSLFGIIESEKAGQVEPARDHILIGKERHDVGRPYDWGYPIRGIVKKDMLYIHNYEIDRWPGGNPETGYLNCDGGATKTVLLQQRRTGETLKYWQLCFGKRPAEELYSIKNDPDCVENLIDHPDYQAAKKALRKQMETELKEQGDPRMSGEGDIFEKFEYAQDGNRNFYERYMNGERPGSGWVNRSDFETEPLD